MDFSKLNKTEQFVGIGGAVGVVAAFLPWYSASAFGFSYSVNGMTSWLIFSFLASVLALLMVVLPLFGTKLPKLGVENKVIYIVLGAVVGGVPVLALVSGMSNGLSSSSLGGYGSAGPGLGLWAAIAAGALVLFGAFMGASSKPSAPTEAPKE